MRSPHPRKAAADRDVPPPTEPTGSGIPEWLETIRVAVENEGPIIQTLIRRAISAVLEFTTLSEDSAVNATAAPTDLAVLIRALSSDELLNDLKTAEPLAPAFLRGIKARQRLLEEHGGTLSSDEVAAILGISRQAVEKRRRAGKLLALSTGGHGYRYPVWQFDESGVLPGLDDVLKALAPHDEWMQTAFFLGSNPRLGDRTPVHVLKAGGLSVVLGAAEVYGEHGAA